MNRQPLSLINEELQQTHLFQQQFPVDAHRSLLVLPAILPQAPRQFAHPLQAVSTVQQILNVLGHNLRDILQLVVNPVEVLRRTTVLVQLLGTLDECIELNESIRS